MWVELWFGWFFMIVVGIMFINVLFLYCCMFLFYLGCCLFVIKKIISFMEYCCLIIDLVSYILYGYILMVMFYLVS